MDADMYDDDDDDDEEDEVMEQENSRSKKKDKPRGNRLSDQVGMDDEPALVGYERCVLRRM